MKYRHILTIFAIILTCQHGEVVSVSPKRSGRAVQPEECVILTNIGNHAIANRLRENITVNQRQDPQRPTTVSAARQNQPARVISTANIQTIQNYLHLIEPPPITTQYRYDNQQQQQQQVNPMRHSVYFAPTHSLMPDITEYSRRNLRQNVICPTPQVFKFNPPLNETRGRAIPRDQRSALTRRRTTQSNRQSQLAAPPLHRQQRIRPDLNFSGNFYIRSSNFGYQHRCNRISTLNSYPCSF